uniref:Speckle-type POZ protein-like (inferred by orthology to a human protein) n=1 Tax=Strongyloides venezuelensis TaxID=75913 RepID=A0A0K0F3J7_STRVS
MYHKDSKAYDGFYNAFELDVTNFRYKYTIENFSQFFEKEDEEIISPTFVVGSREKSEWCLQIYHNGLYTNNDVFVYLELLKPDTVHAKVKFAILNDKEEEKEVFREYHSFEKNDSWFPYVVERNFLQDESNNLLVDDKLTILCEIEHIYFESGNHGNRKPYEVSNTKQTDNYFKYIYTIENFSHRPEKKGEKIISPTFVVGSKERSEWCLHIYPKGEECFRGEVLVHLVLLKPDEVVAFYKCSFLNNRGEEKYVNTEYKSFRKGCEYFRDCSIEKKSLLNESNDLLFNDKLMILCEAKITELKFTTHKNSIPYDVFFTNQTDVTNFKYKYTIENFSQCFEYTGEKIISPTFIIGDKKRSEWCLLVYPNGDEEESKEYVSVYLTLLKPDKAKGKYKFSILNDKKEEKNVKFVTESEDFVKDIGLGFSQFVKRDFLLNKSNGLLNNNKLTIRCEAEIFELESENHENSIPYDVLYISQTDVNNFKYMYTIQNFSLRPEKTGEKIISPTFVVGSEERSEWCLLVYPNGDEEESKEYVSVYLTLLKPDKAKGKYKFSILNDKKEEKNVKFVTESKDFVKDMGLGFPQFVKRDFLLNESNGLLNNNKLTIQCEAEIFELESENHENSIPYDVLYISQTDVNNFKYMYTIQNFSLRPEKTGEKIISPTFIIGDKERSEWCLLVYPNGDEEDSKGFISVYLTLLKPDKAKAKYKFSILNDKKEEKNVKFVTESEDFVKDMGLGFSQFVKRDFLLNESNGLLNNNKLTIQCEAEIVELKSENHENSIPYDVLYTNQTDINNFKYKYTIENFSLRPEKTGEKIISPTFIIGDKERSEWCLLVYPNGDEEDSKGFISVYLTLLKPDKAKAKYKFSILNNKKEEENVKFVTESEDFVKDMGLGFPQFVKRDFLLNESNGLLNNNKLTIQCEAYISDLKTENHDNPQTSMNISIPQSKLSFDYGNLYDSSSFYDCVIKVEDTEIKAQKAILATRSPAFHDIFSSASDESQTNIIEIKDFNVEVVEKMLKFIYNDEVSDIEDMANEIFEIANEYKLDRLKAISEQSMCDSLTIDNVLERFALSDKYPTERLKECCEELIVKNMECLLKTKDWKKYIHSNPSLLERLLLKSHNISLTESSSEDEKKE